MATQTYIFGSAANILTPVQAPQTSLMDAAGFAVSTTFLRGQAVARKTSDNLLYPLNRGATDGTQTFVAFCAYSFKTDANGKCYFVTGTDTAAVHPYASPMSTAPVYTKGIFDPADLITAAGSGSATAEVLTLTPTTPTTGDLFYVTLPNGATVSFTVGGTQTAAAVVTGLKAAWNANSVASALAAATGTATLILTAANPGVATGVTAGVSGTGTFPLVITTAASSAVRAEVDTFTPTNPTTGDVYTITITRPDLSTYAVSATVGATQTATAIVTLLKAAWAADATAAAYATATGTTTLILTGTDAGGSLSLSGSVVGTGTVAKVVTTSALGRSIDDIRPGAPGARVLHNGYWDIP